MELIDLLPKVAEYGAVGVLALALYLIARMYLPHFAALAGALAALPPALAALTDRVELVQDGLGEVRAELAVIKDRLPRADARDEILADLVRRRQARAAGD